MMKKLLKRSLLGVAMLAMTVGFSQGGIITVTEITQSFASIELGQTITFDISYKNTGDAVVGTSQFYIFGSGTGGPTVSNNVQINYEATTTDEEIKTATATVNFIGTETVTKGSVTTNIVNSTDLATAVTNGRYEYRMFVAGGGFTWAPVAEHFTGASNNNSGGFLGAIVEVSEIVNPTADLDVVEFETLVAYVSGDALVVAEAGDYQVLNIAGAVVFEGSVSGSIDISGLASGVYILKSANGTSKFVK